MDAHGGLRGHPSFSDTPVHGLLLDDTVDGGVCGSDAMAAFLWLLCLCLYLIFFRTGACISLALRRDGAEFEMGRNGGMDCLMGVCR